MEAFKQPLQREKLLPAIAVISIFLLFINCSPNKEQKFITGHNLNILDTVMKKVCHRWKKDPQKEEHQVHIINFSDEGFNYILDLDKVFNFKENLEYKEIFTEDNIQYFKEQLDRHPDDYYTDLLPRNDCYIMKNEIQQEEQIPPPLYWPQDYLMSKVVFTKDFEYALFISGKGGYGMRIYKYEDGNFEPYKSIYLAVF